MSEIYEDFDEEEAYLDCALSTDGQCSKAGSEECDFECPLSHGEFYAGSNLWHKKHLRLPVDGCQCQQCRDARGYYD